MKQLPEFILFRAQFFFVVGISLMTPLPAIALEALLLHYTFQGSHSIITLMISLVCFTSGFGLIRQVEFYLQEKEKIYGIIT